MKNYPSPAIILSAPQMGENIGAAARAMFNFGLTDLRIVNPRDGWPSQAAIDMAAGALAVMPPPRVFTSLADALAGCHYVYGTTARPRDMTKPVFTASSAVQDAKARAQGGQTTAFVFGPERAGLDNDEAALCHALITIPANPDFSSINLGQAVLLLAYEWLSQTPPTSFTSPLPEGGGRVGGKTKVLPARHEHLEEFLVRLENELEPRGFFRSDGLKPTTVRNIRNMFMRADLTDQEVRTLHGIVSALTGKKGQDS